MVIMLQTLYFGLWTGIDKETFYDETRIAILPMGFCYPGKGKSGDLAPKPICAKTWRDQLISSLPNLQLTLVIGQYAQAWHLPFQQKTLTETVRDYASYDESRIARYRRSKLGPGLMTTCGLNLGCGPTCRPWTRCFPRRIQNPPGFRQQHSPRW